MAVASTLLAGDTKRGTDQGMDWIQGHERERKMSNKSGGTPEKDSMSYGTSVATDEIIETYKEK